MRKIALALLAAGPFPLAAQDTSKEIRKYQQMIAEGSPVELFEIGGEVLDPASPVNQ